MRQRGATDEIIDLFLESIKNFPDGVVEDEAVTPKMTVMIEPSRTEFS